MRRLSRGAGLLAGLMAAQASGQPPSPHRIDNLVEGARIIAHDRCAAPSQGSDEIVVCGRRDGGQVHRVPDIFRDRAPARDSTPWSARTLDFDEENRSSDTRVGPNGALKHARQIDREWRAERAQIARDRSEQQRQIAASGR